MKEWKKLGLNLMRTYKFWMKTLLKRKTRAREVQPAEVITFRQD
jgi:cyclopropane fatty-acyl-phospholipid synthase-like methyltransferase